jgi:hypothetical protein
MSVLWRDLRQTPGFNERHHYIDWTPFEWLNHDATWLQWMSVYQLAAPILSMVGPILIVLIPLIILWSNGQPFSEYWTIFCRIASGHSLGRLLTQFGSVSWEQRVGLLLSAAFYLFGTYQNIVFCTRFMEIQRHMYASLRTIESFCRATIDRMTTICDVISKVRATTYAPWVADVIACRDTLSALIERIGGLVSTPSSLDVCQNMGEVAKVFYDLHANANIGAALGWSFEFHAYVTCVEAMSRALAENRITVSKFTTKGSTSFRGLVYPPLLERQAVQNDVSFADGNIVITGPNASGKTTVIKAAILNVILTQQWGCGTYRAATVRLYDNIHCYMNIPDTSGRDSLFQAEARRCKQILDVIEDGDRAHFCVFDELYSGTNPEEATACSVKFIEYLGRHCLVDCLFTTHFLGICEAKGVQCFGMNKYEMRPGISRVRGGAQILRDMGYPAEAIPQMVGV